MYETLGERIKAYEANYDTEIMRRVPIVVRVDGRSFSRYCRKLRRPYEPLLMEAMAKTMLYVASEMAGCCFAFHQSDEISFVLRNDQSLESDPWYGNRVQKLVSIAASLTTLAFNKQIDLVNKSLSYPLNTTGEALFDARVFAVPSVGEACNALIWRQQDCSKNAINSAAIALLGKKLGKKTALEMLSGRSAQERIDLMRTECGVDFHEEFHNAFRLGVGAYKIPVVSEKELHLPKKKWIIDGDLPLFTSEKDFLYSIILNGHDVFRADSIKSL